MKTINKDYFQYSSKRKLPDIFNEEKEPSIKDVLCEEELRLDLKASSRKDVMLITPRNFYYFVQG